MGITPDVDTMKNAKRDVMKGNTSNGHEKPKGMSLK